MRIKITCTQAEFASLVRGCERINGGYGSSCASCVFGEICGDQARIENVVDVMLDEGGAVNG